MPLRKAVLVTGAVVLMTSLGPAQTSVIGPPLGLEYGMTYSEAKALLKSKDIKLEDLKEDKDYKAPKGFKIAKVGKYELLGKKTDVNLACFNADGELCAFQINLRFYEADAAKTAEKARGFYESEIRKALIGKYSGQGFKEHKTPDQDGNIPELAYSDEVGNEVAVYLHRQKSLLGDVWFVLVYYSNEEILTATRKDQKETDKI